jgi:hypothetical protein
MFSRRRSESVEVVERRRESQPSRALVEVEEFGSVADSLGRPGLSNAIAGCSIMRGPSAS